MACDPHPAWRWLQLGVLALAAIGCGGQSGNEGELPAAPCAREDALVVGHIESVGGGCVSVRVERVVSAGALTSLDVVLQQLERGATISGRLGRIYSSRHDFQQGDAVVVIASAGEASPAGVWLELFPYRDDRAEVQWGLAQLQIELNVLHAPDCDERLWARRESAPQLESTLSDHGVTTPPANPEPMCGVTGSR